MTQISSGTDEPTAEEEKEPNAAASLHTTATRWGEHRTSCHRCGNLRKKKLSCEKCPMVFCARCCEKMKEEYGTDVFNTEKGCPVVRA
jgi:late competence protein required for DNA uptake (superfamily II DNA/RNA helicase)